LLPILECFTITEVDGISDGGERDENFCGPDEVNEPWNDEFESLDDDVCA